MKEIKSIINFLLSLTVCDNNNNNIIGGEGGTLTHVHA